MDDSVAHVTFEIIQETLCITCCITPNNREKYIRRERRFLFWTCNETPLLWLARGWPFVSE